VTGTLMKRSTVRINRLSVSVAEAAETLGLSKATVWDEIKKGRLKVARVGRRVLVPVSSMRAWLAAAMSS